MIFAWYEDGRYPKLAPGDTGFWVQKLQSLLIGAGYEDVEAPSAATFGPKTAVMVQKLQADVGLAPSGIVDAITWAKLQLLPSTRMEVGTAERLMAQQTVGAPLPVAPEIATPILSKAPEPEISRAALPSLDPAIVPLGAGTILRKQTEGGTSWGWLIGIAVVIGGGYLWSRR